MDTDEGLYHAKPQTRGKIAHETVDKKTASNRKDELLSLPVYSNRYKLMGKVDVYRLKEKKLIERKYRLKQIFQGQIYQLWAQYICLKEMGYEVNQLAFYEISTNKMMPVSLPDDQGMTQFTAFKLRTRFSKMLTKNGAIRLQYSVYEINNTNRVLENLMIKIEQFASIFDGGDSVIVFDVSEVKLTKYGNAIHRDVDIVYL